MRHKNTVVAALFAHALTIPKTVLRKKAVKEFAEMFLAVDKEAEGFLPCEGIVSEVLSNKFYTVVIGSITTLQMDTRITKERTKTRR